MKTMAARLGVTLAVLAGLVTATQAHANNLKRCAMGDRFGGVLTICQDPQVSTLAPMHSCPRTTDLHQLMTYVRGGNPDYQGFAKIRSSLPCSEAEVLIRSQSDGKYVRNVYWTALLDQWKLVRWRGEKPGLSVETNGAFASTNLVRGSSPATIYLEGGRVTYDALEMRDCDALPPQRRFKGCENVDWRSYGSHV